MSFAEQVKAELNNKIEALPLKTKKELVRDALISGEPIEVPIDGNVRDLRAMLKGAFLGVGTISDPLKSYHIEFRCKTREHGLYVVGLLNRFDIYAKLIKRSNMYGVYIKKSDDIIKILNIIGAHKSLFKMEDTKILREVTNDVNRKVNCETFNIKKMSNASARQIKDINLIKDKIGLENLDTQLEEVALIRIKNPDLSLEEIASLVKPKVTKSGINHRFRKIHEIAEELKDE